MPKKYHISTIPTQARFAPTGKSTVLDWEGGCLRCFKCVKRKCIFGAYNKRTFDVSQLSDTIDNICKNCLRCVQECPGQVITKILNPEYTAMGNDYWTSDIISKQWYQAETGSIPVSGAGYSGPFSGPGFDAMWTDMSEIVRPTRDGIHGREYINTMVSIGRKRPSISFDDQGRPVFDFPVNIEIPIPMIFGELPFGSLSDDVYLTIFESARSMGTLVEIALKDFGKLPESCLGNAIVRISQDQIKSHPALIEKAAIVEIDDNGAAFSDMIEEVKTIDPGCILMVRHRLNETSAERVSDLALRGADIIHLKADRNGTVFSHTQPEQSIGFIKDHVRQVHRKLVEEGIRDEVTLIAGGGIAMAEHVAKAIICGADAVSVDVPLLLALECRMCLRCERQLACPVEIENVHPDWGKHRIMNLMAAWRNQILEVLGAMGIREVRRLRGEVGRAMFFEDLEQETFGKLFGNRI